MRSATKTASPDIDDSNSFLDRSWIEKVATTPDNDLRTHRIALTYARLADCLDRLIFGGKPSKKAGGQKRAKQPKASADMSVTAQLGRHESVSSCNANWFHFATWATATITPNIANNRPPQRIDSLPMSALRRELTPKVVHARAASGQRVSRSLSWGQRLVFVSSSLALVDFAQQLDRDKPVRLARSTKRKIDDLTSWNCSNWIGHERHLKCLDTAFGYYRRARALRSEPDVSARLMLGGNVLIMAVDQDIIDHAIETTVNHIPQRVAASLEGFTAKWAERMWGIPRQLSSLSLPYRYKGPRDALDTAWSRLMTDQVFVMTLPTETLRLGRDIPPRYTGRPFYPEALRRLTAGEHKNLGSSPAEAEAVRREIDEISALVSSLDRTMGNGRGSAARDWRLWDERVNWALTLIRSRQQDETLFWAPYSQEDQQRIVDGVLPLRGGDPASLEVQAPSGAVVIDGYMTKGGPL
ncbi:MAG TPA: hypothetical protein VFB94_13320 [Acidimicrobiales bacterium]|nr:hypothetical protein [Acidimicrobiales bacterium]HZO67303.1 hypothetical protein [Kribbellaceae bacterium]